MKVWLTMLSLLTASTVFAHMVAEGEEHEFHESEIPISMTTDAEGRNFLLAADAHAVEATPKWDGTGEPPLSTGKALALAIDWLKENEPEFAEFHAERITLQRVWHDGLEDRWIVAVTVRAIGSLGRVKVSHQFEVAVLMDETVVGPQEVEP